MSKKKQKKNDGSMHDNLYEAQKRDNYDYQFTIKKLQDKLSFAVVKNEELTKQLSDIKKVSEERIKILEMQTVDDEERLKNQILKITDLEINTVKMDNQLSHLKDELNLQKQHRSKETSELKTRMNNERNKFDIQLKELQHFAETKEKYENQMMDLRNSVQSQKEHKMKEIADKEREKIIATDHLQRDMLHRIKEMRVNLLSLKKEQLDTTTRLTVLQNHQLTSQLEYQSKQTQKILCKEEQLMTKVRKLSQQIQIHKQVEGELAKRAQCSKSMIKKLTERILQLEEKLKKSIHQNCSLRTIKTQRFNKQQSTTQIKSRVFIDHSIDGNEANDSKQLLTEIEKQLEITEKKYMDLESKLEAEKKQKKFMFAEIKKYQNSSNEMAKMLIFYSEEVLAKNELMIDQKENEEQETQARILKVDLQKLRNSSIEDWSHEEVSLVVKVMINVIKPYLTKKNILIPPIKKLLLVEDCHNFQTNESQSKLPKIGLQNSFQMRTKALRNLPTNIASKIVGTNIREWGQTVRNSGILNIKPSNLKRKIKVSNSER